VKVLVLAPHADDLELGCGGTVARLVGEGHDIYQLCFSLAPKDISEPYDEPQRLGELLESFRVLHGTRLRVSTVATFFHRDFGRVRQEILDEIIKEKKEIEPDMVILPCANDRHQDHQVIYAEGVRGLKGLKGVKTILGYDTPWNHMINGNFFVPLTKGDVEKKIEAIACYESVKHKPYADPEFLWAWARFRGLQAGCEFAEVHELIRGGL
jgi:LmbE family N-acetylglucosaminyl deacetylase